MKIFWQSVPLYNNTGYGIQSREIVKRLKADGHEVYVVATTQLDDGAPITQQEGVTHLPGGWLLPGPTNKGCFGWQGTLEFAARMKPDLVVTLLDLWVLPDQFGDALKDMGIPWAALGPIDHDPVPERVLLQFQNATYKLAMAPFTERQLRKHGIANPIYMPHGVNTKTYHPSSRDKEIVGANDSCFVVGTVALNIDKEFDRKGWQQHLEAFAKLAEKHDDAIYYIHTETAARWHGVNIDSMASKMGIAQKIHHPDSWELYSGFPAQHMARLYNAMDVHMLISKGEGFGVPTVEAQACGTPVIVNDFTASPDLVGAGWKIPTISKLWTNLHSWMGLVDSDKAGDVLLEAYDLWKSGEIDAMRKEAREFALQFDFDKIYRQHWKPFLKKVKNEKAQKETADAGVRQAA